MARLADVAVCVDLPGMSWLDRLLGVKPPTAPANSVTIEPGLASQLTAAGEPLDVAVDGALRECLEARRKAAESAETNPIPFWLRRDDARTRDIDDELRDRVIQRQVTEESGQAGGPVKGSVT
jgi:hypothetical protein